MNRAGTAPRAPGKLGDAGRATLFTQARAASTSAAAPASDPGLPEIRELAKRAPASAGTRPLRVLYARAHRPEGAGLLRAGQAAKDKNSSLSTKIPG